MGRPASCACKAGAGQECVAAHHCVGGSLGALRPLSLDYKFFQMHFAGIKA